MLVAKIRAFPDADVDWYIKHPVPEGEEGEPTNEKIDKDDAKFKDRLEKLVKKAQMESCSIALWRPTVHV